MKKALFNENGQYMGDCYELKEKYAKILKPMLKEDFKKYQMVHLKEAVHHVIQLELTMCILKNSKD